MLPALVNDVFCFIMQNLLFDQSYAFDVLLHTVSYISEKVSYIWVLSDGPRQANLVLIAYASSEDSGEPAHPHSLARTSAARSYKQ